MVLRVLEGADGNFGPIEDDKKAVKDEERKVGEEIKIEEQPELVDEDKSNAELSRDDANLRHKLISDVHYDLVLSFLNDEKTYEGYVRITFKLDTEALRQEV